MCEFKTKKVVIKNKSNLKELIDYLIDYWFTVVPLSDSEWEVWVKEENYSRVVDFLYAWSI